MITVIVVIIKHCNS